MDTTSWVTFSSLILMHDLVVSTPDFSANLRAHYLQQMESIENAKHMNIWTVQYMPSWEKANKLYMKYGGEDRTPLKHGLPNNLKFQQGY